MKEKTTWSTAVDLNPTFVMEPLFSMNTPGLGSRYTIVRAIILMWGHLFYTLVFRHGFTFTFPAVKI